MIDAADIQEILRTRPDGRLYHREGQELEFKEQFNLGGLAEYLRDFAAFANNRGGYLVFGVADSPRVPAGLSDSAVDQFERVDPQKITGNLLELFAPSVEWEQQSFEIDGRVFGVFRVHEAKTKPVIARKDEGKQQTIKNSEIYYRYGGRTQKIRFAELASIIDRRIEQTNQQWIDLVQKIGAAGPSNAAILDAERAVIEKEDSRVLVLDDDLAEKLRFIKSGEFQQSEGAPALKLIGDVVPVEKVEVVRRVRENLIKDYPLSAMELAEAVREQYPRARQHRVWDVIRENGLKEDRAYSAYNFRNKKQEDEFNASGYVPPATPSIYNSDAVDFVVNVLRNDDGDA